jgi:hypothetical protein
MSIENGGATSDVELESVLACEGDLSLDEPANFEAEPTSPTRRHLPHRKHRVRRLRRAA